MDAEIMFHIPGEIATERLRLRPLATADTADACCTGRSASTCRTSTPRCPMQHGRRAHEVP